MNTKPTTHRKLFLTLLTLLVTLVALGGAPRAWGAYPSSATGTYTVNQVSNTVIYTFTGSGTFTPAVGLTANVLVVGGGGGGGGAGGSASAIFYDEGGGGGAGGFVAQNNVALTGGNPYTVTVGAGGAGGVANAYGSYTASKGANGGNSVFGTISATGGGGGGAGFYDYVSSPNVDYTDGLSGGSGGGGGRYLFIYNSVEYYVNGALGAGTGGQGNNGVGGDTGRGGGGGGAGAAASVQNGGNGTASSISGASVTYAGGGGAGTSASPSGTGGTGGGGAGTSYGNGTAGTANRGGGGGGGANGATATSYNGGRGGSGIVIVSYQWPASAANSTISASPSSLTADGVATTIITVTAKDLNNNVMSGIPAALVVVAATGSSNTLVQPTTATDANGQTTATLKSTKAEAKTVSVTIAGTPITQTATVTFTPASTTSVALTTGSNPSTYGDSLTFTATVTGTAPTTPTGTVAFKDGANTLGTGTLSGSGASATATFTTNTLSAGTHSTITAVYGGDGNYATSTSGNLSQTVNARPVSLSGSRTYDGTTEAASGILTIANNLDGANLTLSGSATLASKNVGSPAVSARTVTRVNSATNAVGSTAASSFTVTVTAPTSGNTLVAVISTRSATANAVSSISQSGATWSRVASTTGTAGTTTEIWYAPNVSSAGPTVTINLASSLFAAAVVAEYSGVLSASPVDVTTNSTGNSASAVTSTTAATAQGNELWIGGIGLVNSGYTLTNPLNSFSSVGPATSGSGTAASNARVYALEKIVTATGTANSGGTVSTSSQWSGAIATFKTTPPALAGSAAGNYTLTGLSGSVTITAKALTVSGLTASAKVYDGTTTEPLGGTAAFQTAEAPGSGTTSDGIPYNVDSVSAGGTAAGAFATKDVGTAKAVTVTGVTVTGTGNGNYTVTQQTGLTANISKATLTVSATGVNKTYDGTTAATVTLSDNHLGSDVVTESYTSATFADKNVGTGKAVNVSGISISGAPMRATTAWATPRPAPRPTSPGHADGQRHGREQDLRRHHGGDGDAFGQPPGQRRSHRQATPARPLPTRTWARARR